MADLSYSKEEMANEIADLKEKFQKFAETNKDLEACIQTVGENWNEHDADAINVLEALKNEYNNFKSKLEEMHSLMLEFTTNMDQQIDNFKGAENKIMSQF